MSQLGAQMSQLGASLGQLGTPMSHLKAIMGQQGAEIINNKRKLAKFPLIWGSIRSS